MNAIARRLGLAGLLLSTGLVSGALVSGALVSGAMAAPAPAAPIVKSKDGIPLFSAGGHAWVLETGTAYLPVPGYKGPGPVVQRGAAYKHDVVKRVAETNNPILQPWAKKIMDDANDKVAKGGLPFVNASRCWPGGVPGILLYPGEPVVFLQTPGEVWIVGRDEQVRRIYMNAAHRKNPGYSWYGDSVGHYENGDTLVVDTIGLDDKGPLDRYRTPHTKKLHVVERYTMKDDGHMHVIVDVDDPGAFTTPWKAEVDFVRGKGPTSAWKENICAENPYDPFTDNLPDIVPMPHADKPEF
jgi:hypothetical protein